MFRTNSLILALLLASPAAGRSVVDQFFSGVGSCYAREYSVQHLAKHPAQTVTRIALRPNPENAVGDALTLTVSVQVRGSTEVLAGDAYCTPTSAKTLQCGMEGDAGSFLISPQAKGNILLSVGPYGMIFEGSTDFITLSDVTGDDRSFLLSPVSDCN